jgi:hypothetical protein
MATHPLHHRDLGHALWLDWLLILTGALLAWLLWPAAYH